jgi:hypothetical protein
MVFQIRFMQSEFIFLSTYKKIHAVKITFISKSSIIPKKKRIIVPNNGSINKLEKRMIEIFFWLQEIKSKNK